ncbi:MAG: hypothetical protein COB51_12755 [Moraxellaceae bacterium]|nr:MAG: hypothetical protein COB51_12755 [Moraxellaceae bacterium]
MIRVAVLADYKDISSFDPFSGNRKEDIDENRVYVYIKDDCVRGFLSFARAGLLGRAFIQYLAVDPEYRRINIASSLFSHIEEKYAADRLFISTESSNKPMQDLLKKRDYISAGKISGANKNGTDELYYYKDRNA